MRKDNTGAVIGQTAVAYKFCSGVNGGVTACPTYPNGADAHGAYVAIATPEDPSGTQNGPFVKTYYDMLGRVVATDTQGFDASAIRTIVAYDTDFHVKSTTRPFFVAGGTQELTTYSYSDPQGDIFRSGGRGSSPIRTPAPRG